MALNALPYDPALFGTAAGAAQMQRLYPQWMTDAKKRGIGVGQDFTAAVPGLIAIPSGPLTDATVPPVVGYAPPQQDMGDPASGAGARGGNMAEGGGASGALGAEPTAPTSGGLADFLANFGIANPGYGGATGGGSYDGISGQLPGDWSGTAAANDMQAIADSMGATSGTAALGDVQAAEMSNPGDLSGQQGAPGTEGFMHGGVVTRNRLTGPNPPGPDDGYAALNAGEGVLTKKAMDYYGADFLRRLNKLQVPKGR